MNAQVPHRLQTHYCRECGKRFDIEDKDVTLSPHSHVWIHSQRLHGWSIMDYQSCSRYCKEVAQPEEIAKGERLYGDGIPHAPPNPAPIYKPYEELFPPEEEDQ